MLSPPRAEPQQAVQAGEARPQHFLHRYSAAYGRPVPEVTTAALAVLRDFPWPGNVWELEYLVARLVATSDHQVLDAEEVWTVLYLEHL